MMLESAGHRVVEAESAEDAIIQFRTMESVDLLVSDLQMPGLSGLELFDRLVARLPSLRCCSSPEPPAPPTSRRSRERSGLAREALLGANARHQGTRGPKLDLSANLIASQDPGVPFWVPAVPQCFILLRAAFQSPRPLNANQN